MIDLDTLKNDETHRTHETLERDDLPFQEPENQINSAEEYEIESLTYGDIVRLNNVFHQSRGDMKIIRTLPGSVIGKSIQDLNLPEEISILALERNNSRFIFPTPRTVLHKGDIVYFVGKMKGIDHFVKHMGD